MREMNPIWVKARHQCPVCGGEVERQWYGKNKEGEECRVVWVCQNPNCKFYKDNLHTFKPTVFLTCPKCHQEIAHCAGHDIGGGNDFWDRYYLYCVKCGAMEYVTKYGGQKDSVSEQSTDCPYCGLGIYSHDQPTPELLKLFERAGAVHNNGQDFSVFIKNKDED